MRVESSGGRRCATGEGWLPLTLFALVLVLALDYHLFVFH